MFVNRVSFESGEKINGADIARVAGSRNVFVRCFWVAVSFSWLGEVGRSLPVRPFPALSLRLYAHLSCTGFDEACHARLPVLFTRALCLVRLGCAFGSSEDLSCASAVALLFAKSPLVVKAPQGRFEFRCFIFCRVTHVARYAPSFQLDICCPRKAFYPC